MKIKRWAFDDRGAPSLILNHFTAYIEDITNKQYAAKYPTMDDLSGAAEALSRLQYVYNLETKELADGNLGGVDYRYLIGI